MLIDTHCHLTAAPLSDDPAGVLARARGAGVTSVVVPAYDLASHRAVIAAAATDGGVHPALGLHPWVADEPLDQAALAADLAASGAVAVGEIGLDFKVPAPLPERQLAVLRQQLELAADLGLPVILHCRGAFEELAAELGRFGGALPGVLHAFSRGTTLAQRFLALGLHLGFGGAVTRPGARRVRASAAAAPLERMLLETDAPSIGLDGIEPQDVEPRHVREVAVALAAIREATLDEIARSTSENARRLFRLPT